MSAFQSNIPSVCFLTLGCAKNEVDSQHMMENLKKEGFLIKENPSDAQVVVINTCSFIRSAIEESLDTIFDIAHLDSITSSNAKLIVTGCMPSRYGEELSEELPEVDAFLDCAHEGDIVRCVKNLLELSDDEKVDASKLSKSEAESEDKIPDESRYSAYVKISEGCDRFCSYCTIPFIRGRYYSYSYEQIAEEVQAHIDGGVREIVIIAQDTGRWGTDLEKKSSLADLLDSLANRHQETWFRVMYLQPEGVSNALLDVIDSHKNICSYLDIPLQHVSKRILRAMNRKGSYDDYAGLINHIRKRIPDICLRTTLIAGFPGESDEEFQLLCEFLEEMDLDYVGVFPYSQEEGTKAAMLANQISDELKIERAQILRDLADSLSSLKISQRIATVMPVLVLGFEEDGQLYGRTQCQAPEVDGVVYLDKGRPGEIIDVTIDDTLLYEMEGSS